METIGNQRFNDEPGSQPDAARQRILRSTLAKSPADRTTTARDILQLLADELTALEPPEQSSPRSG
ncbi:hypothetical protein Mal15_67460 [Stieleria maiorica]|uniref:Uncharacterized protein n=1 Tax=Stieleria maiorica TaxID=2795974 RepID=A0A5B9MRT7_9BACT|nr:hypothetical protein Mal15_67460 [Stieleria maiorica]